MNDQKTEKSSELFRRGLNSLGIVLDERSLKGLTQYSLELIKWNRKVNLVAKNTSLKDIVEKHFLDSLTLVPVLDKYVSGNAQLLDVGSGAGFPGLVIKTACPERMVTLLEPRQRRVSFLNHIVRLLQISGIEVLPKRTDEILPSPDSKYEVITGRAVADVTAFLEMVTDLASPGSFVICMQGPSGMKQWENEKDTEKYSKVAVEHIQLPFSQADRSILLFQKN